MLTAITFFVLLSPFLLIYQKFSLLNPSPTSSVVNVSFFVGYFRFCISRDHFFTHEYSILPPPVREDATRLRFTISDTQLCY